jgi:hypothetical protein
MQKIRVAEHLGRTKHVKCPDWWHSNDKDTARAPRDGTRMSTGTCSFVFGLLAHGHTENHKPGSATTQRLPDRNPLYRVRKKRRPSIAPLCSGTPPVPINALVASYARVTLAIRKLRPGLQPQLGLIALNAQCLPTASVPPHFGSKKVS